MLHQKTQVYKLIEDPSADVFFRYNETDDKWELQTTDPNYKKLIQDSTVLQKDPTNLFLTNARADAPNSGG